MMHLDKLPNSQPGERVVLVLRRHWIDLLRILVFSAVLALVPAAVFGIIFVAEVNILSHPVYAPLSISLLFSYVFLLFTLTITEITDYWLDVWIVTTERIINTEQHGLFNRLVSEVRLEQIQDVTSETLGFLETFLTYGDVYIQTAGEKMRFRFKNIDNPDEVKISIIQLSTECQDHHHHTPPAQRQASTVASQIKT